MFNSLSVADGRRVLLVADAAFLFLVVVIFILLSLTLYSSTTTANVDCKDSYTGEFILISSRVYVSFNRGRSITVCISDFFLRQHF